MAKLHQLYRNLLEMSPKEQVEFFASYSARRHRDLVETVKVKAKTSGTKSSKPKETVKVSSEAFEILKKLGLIK